MAKKPKCTKCGKNPQHAYISAKGRKPVVYPWCIECSNKEGKSANPCQCRKCLKKGK